MAVFPEDMNRIDANNPEEAIKTIDEFIRYMCQRVEFSTSQLTKSVSASGISSAELYILVQAMSNQISALQSTVNGMVGRLNGIDQAILGIQGDISDINGDIETINGTLTSLDERVTALEERNE